MDPGGFGAGENAPFGGMLAAIDALQPQQGLRSQDVGYGDQPLLFAHA